MEVINGIEYMANTKMYCRRCRARIQHVIGDCPCCNLAINGIIIEEEMTVEEVASRYPDYNIRHRKDLP